MRDERGEAILRERIRRVVHNATDVVLFAEVCDCVLVVLVKVAGESVLDVLPSNGHVLVTSVRALHVVEAKSVQKFVDDCALVDTTVQLQIKILDATATTDKRPAATVFTLQLYIGHLELLIRRQYVN